MRGSIVWFEMEHLERVNSELLVLPEQRQARVSCKAAIEFLSPAIASLVDKGYSRKDIVAQLAERGVAVSDALLRVYFRPRGKTAAGSKGQAHRKSVRQSSGARPAAAAAAIVTRAANSSAEPESNGVASSDTARALGAPTDAAAGADPVGRGVASSVVPSYRA